MNPPAETPPDVTEFTTRLASALTTELGDDLVGVYLHGSAALGGYVPNVSDIDLLAVIAHPRHRRSQQRLGELLQHHAYPCPGVGLEASVITAATAHSLDNCPFEVHVTTEPDHHKLVCGARHRSDPDLILHVAVCREHGIAIAGPPPTVVFGPVPRHRILPALLHELDWAKQHGTEAYAVLNACRAWRYAATSDFVSKIEAGDWATAQGAPDIVTDALDQQRSGHHHKTPSPAARAFVEDIEQRLRVIRQDPQSRLP